MFMKVNLGGMGVECFPKNKKDYFTGYTGRILRILVLRNLDSICEEGNEGVLGSEVMEEEVMLWNVLNDCRLGRYRHHIIIS